MRSVSRIGIVAAAMLALAGCGKAPDSSDQNGATSFSGGFETGFRKGWREKFVPACATAAEKANPNAPINMTTLCGCVADKLLASKTVAQLSMLDDDEGAPLAKQCVDEGKVR